MRAKLIDISKYQATFKNKGNLDGIIIRSSYGLMKDNRFVELTKAAKDVPVRGAYHYYSSNIPWETQAKFFVEQVKDKGFHFFALDFERGFNNKSAGFASTAEKWMQYAADATGKKVVLYTNPATYEDWLLPYGNWMTKWMLWVAQWPFLPKPQTGNPKMTGMRRSDWVLWQYCVAPDTPILTSDLRWIPVGELKIGQELIGFNEKTTTNGLTLLRSKVLANEPRKMSSLRLHFADGDFLDCATGHPLLARLKNKTGTIKSNISWMTAQEISDKLAHGTVIMLPRYFETWKRDTSWGAGYLAGGFDGEGSLSLEQGHNYQLQFAQNDNMMLELFLRLLDNMGIRYSDNFGNHSTAHKIYIKGGKALLLKLLGMIRPPRLMEKVLSCPDFGSLLSRNNAEVIKVESLGDITVSGLTTDSGTYFAKGFASHNSGDGNRKGAVYGVGSRDVDEDVFNGTVEELYAWAGVETEPPIPEPPDPEPPIPDPPPDPPPTPPPSNPPTDPKGCLPAIKDFFKR